jgi:protein-tyrosine phosphatase
VYKYVCLLFLFAGGAASADDPGQSSTAPHLSAVQQGRSRSLELRGAPNFRDIGGYPAADGRHVRWNRVYRSSELTKLTQADAQRVAAIQFAAVIDLRSDEERKRFPSVWVLSPPDVYQSPKITLASVMQTSLVHAQTPEGARRDMITLYTEMPDNYRDEYSAMFRRVAAGELPVLVHCTAGKDRTGVAIALLLTALGVSQDVVVSDYELSEKLVPPPAAPSEKAAPIGGAGQAQSLLANIPDASRRVLMRADPVYVAAALDSVTHEYGSTDGYLEHGLGLTQSEVRAVRAALLE